MVIRIFFPIIATLILLCVGSCAYANYFKSSVNIAEDEDENQQHEDIYTLNKPDRPYLTPFYQVRFWVTLFSGFLSLFRGILRLQPLLTCYRKSDNGELESLKSSFSAEDIPISSTSVRQSRFPSWSGSTDRPKRHDSADARCQARDATDEYLPRPSAALYAAAATQSVRPG